MAALLVWGRATGLGAQPIPKEKMSLVLTVCLAAGEQTLPGAPVDLILEMKGYGRRPIAPSFELQVDGSRFRGKELIMQCLRGNRQDQEHEQYVRHVPLFYYPPYRPGRFLIASGTHTILATEIRSGATAEASVTVAGLPASERAAYEDFIKLEAVPQLLLFAEDCFQGGLLSDKGLRDYLVRHPGSVYKGFVEAALAIWEFVDTDLRWHRDGTLARDEARRALSDIAGRLLAVYESSSSSLVRQRALHFTWECQRILGRQQAPATLRKLATEYRGFPLGREALTLEAEDALIAAQEAAVPQDSQPPPWRGTGPPVPRTGGEHTGGKASQQPGVAEKADGGRSAALFAGIVVVSVLLALMLAAKSRRARKPQSERRGGLND